MITNLQVVRAFAALGVVLYHTAFVFKGGTHTEFQGVAIFFVLSGFLMTYLAQEEASGREFLERRLVRIVPMYWLICLLSVLWFSYGLANLPYTLPVLCQWLTNDPKQILYWLATQHGLGNMDLLGRLAKSFLFVPYRDAAGDMHPILGVGWTLNLEMFFYFVFAVSITIGNRFAPAIAALGIVAVKGLDIWTNGSFQTLHFYAHDYTWYFILGIAMYYVWRALPADVSRIRLPLVLASFAFTCFFALVNAGPEWLRLKVNDVVPMKWLMWAMPSIVIFLAACLHSAGLCVRLRAAILLGDASYAIYLSHTVLIESMRPLGERWGWLNASKTISGMLLAVIGSTLLGIALHLYIERPLLKSLRARINKSPTGIASAA